MLKGFVERKGEPRAVLASLIEDGCFKGHKVAEETMKEMELLFSYCEAMNCLDNLSFDFSLARGLDYYTGLIYEAVFVEGTGTRFGSIAGGGRYDGLIGMFSSQSIPAIGVSIGIERMFLLLEEQAKAENAVRASETQVLVASIGKGMVTERLKLLNELWATGVKAEALYNDNPKPQRQLDYAFENGIPLIIWIGEDEIADSVFKVKQLNSQKEEFYPRSQLIPVVRELVRANPVLLPKSD